MNIVRTNPRKGLYLTPLPRVARTASAAGTRPAARRVEPSTSTGQIGTSLGAER